MMSAKSAYAISMIAGLGVLALTVFSLMGPSVPACGGLAKNYAPIIAFELARSVTDLHAIFGASPGVCRAAIAARLDFIDRVDSLLFIQIYGAFLLFFFLAKRDRKLGKLGALLVIASCLADHVENFALFHLSAAPDTPGRWLAALTVATETKWVGLGLANAAGAGLLLRAGGGLGTAGAILCLVGTVAALISIPAPAVIGPYLSNTIALGWLVFFVADVRWLFQGAPVEAAAAEARFQP